MNKDVEENAEDGSDKIEKISDETTIKESLKNLIIQQNINSVLSDSKVSAIQNAKLHKPLRARKLSDQEKKQQKN